MVESLIRRGVRGGQAMIELAFILPLLVILFCAILHFGILFWLQIGLEQGTREAAIFASYHPRDDNVILNMVKLSLPSLVNQQDLAITVTTTGSRSVGDPLTIQIDYKIQLLKDLPFGALLPIPTDVHALVTVPIVQAN